MSSTNSIGGVWELEEWLQQLNLSDYHALLVENGLSSPNDLITVDKAKLRECGVSKPGHLNRLYTAILKLGGRDGEVGECDSTVSSNSSTSDLIGGGSNNQLQDSSPGSLSPTSVDPSSLSNSLAGNITNPPPIPVRRLTAKKRSPSPAESLGPVVDQPMDQQGPGYIPRRVHSLRRKNPGDVAPSPETSTNTMISPTHSSNISPIHIGNNLSPSDVDKGSPTRSGTTSPPVNESPTTSGPPTPTRSSRKGYENVGMKSPTKRNQGPPKPPPRTSSHLTTTEEEDPPPPVIPHQKSRSDLPTVPTVPSYDKILEGEIWSQANENSLTSDVTTGGTSFASTSGAEEGRELQQQREMYETIGDSLPPRGLQQQSEMYETIGDSLPPLPSPIEQTNLYEPIGQASTTSTVVAESHLGSGISEEMPPLVLSEENFPPVPSKEVSPPPTTSLPNFAPPPPPIDVTSDNGDLTPLSPPPPSTVKTNFSPSPLPPTVVDDNNPAVTSPHKFKPPVPNRKSSLISESSFSPPPSTEEQTQPELKPPIPKRYSYQIPENEDPVEMSSPPPFTPSPPPSVTIISQGNNGKTSESPIPPPIPKRGTLSLPPPPPPPISSDDHPECMMQDPETFVSAHKRGGSTVSSNASDDMNSGSGTPGSPLTPSVSGVRIEQISSGSEGYIGLTPPINRTSNPVVIESDYAVLTDSDNDVGSSPYNSCNSSPSLANASTLKETKRLSSLEPLKEDTLLAQTNNTYETISPSPPQPKPRQRPKSSFIEDKKNDLFGSLDAANKTSTLAADGFSKSYNADHSSSSDKIVSPVRAKPHSQSVINLAKDIEKQTLRHGAMMRSKTDPNVIDGLQFLSTDTISPNKYRTSVYLEDVPPTVEGYLHKKGGKKNERPYQKRWVVFDGEELKYFRTKGVKEIDAKNTVKLSEMIDIKRVADPDQTNRFDLVVINRVFQFYSDTEDNAQLWVNVLHAAISKFNPLEGSESRKEGGNMNNPDKQGFLMKQGHGRIAANNFKQRYVALKDSKFAYYDSREDFISAKPIHILDMRLANVKPDMTGKTSRFTITMPNQRSYIFQAGNNLERGEWIEKLHEAILNALNLAPEKKEGKKGVRASDILARIQENPANKTCADCTAEEPSWAIVNRGIMVCIECSGVHRSMGVHISKVRSVELDVEIWTETLIQLFQTIGNEKSNSFWEKHCKADTIDAAAPREIRETYIRMKYESKAWITRTYNDTPDVLSRALCVAVTTNDLMRTTELLVTGADPCFVHPEIEDTERNTPMKIAKAHNQLLQAELLEQNGALLDSTRSESTQISTAFRKGFLSKTGSDRQGWKKRYCTVNAYRGLEYFRTETDQEILGNIKVDNMLGVGQCEIEGVGKDKNCFEVFTPGRAYLFASETKSDMLEWIETIKEITPRDSADKLGYDKVGFLAKRSPQNVGWKRHWFSLKGNKLTYFKNGKEEIASGDMKTGVEIRGPDQGSFDATCTFQIQTPDKVYHLKADNPIDADSWVQALNQSKLSVPLSEQPLTSGSGIPIIVHKCLQFVEMQGLEVEGVYRKSGEKAKSRALLQQFNEDPHAVMIDDSLYTVHDVTGTLKKFLKGLPDPLMTHHLYDAFLNAAVMSDHETKLHQLQSLIDQLPPINKETLKRIISHLLKVAQHESSNKMSQSNLTSLFGPTLMTVDGDPVTVEDMNSQYACIQHMMSYYGWLFNATGEEEKKEEAMQEALKKLQAANEQHMQQTSVTSGMNVSTSFLISVYVGGKDGEVCGMKVTLTTTAAEVVEFVTTTKSLPPTNYCVHLVLGDAESERPLHSQEQVLAVQTTDSYLCLKPNTLADKIKDYELYSGQYVFLHVMEKKKWKKYPCAVKSKYFIIYKDNKCQTELHKIPLFDADLFIGIERKNMDVKNPLPTKYPLSLMVRIKENNKFLCADTNDDRLLIIAAFIFSKHPDGIQTPVMPNKRIPKTFDARNRGISLLNPSGPPPGHPSAYYGGNKQGTKTFVPKKNIGDERLMKELTLRQKSTSPERF